MVRSGQTRLVLRRSNEHFQMQLIQFHEDGDKVLVTTNSKELAKHGWTGATSNTTSAYLTGMLMAKKAKDKKIKSAIFDIGLAKAHKGGVLFAALKGAVDGGLDIPHGTDMFPSDDRIAGKHLKNKNNPFDTVKKKIQG